MKYLEKAIKIAIEAHKNQVDLSGEPYIEHIYRVALSVNGGKDERIVAFLHDVVEDSDMTINDLRAAGFEERIIEAVDILTKREGQPYDSYIDRISTNKIAIAVKVADLKDNMNITRLKSLNDKHIARIKKYHTAYSKLSNLLER